MHINGVLKNGSSDGFGQLKMEIKKMLLYLSLAFVIHSARSESSLTIKRVNTELCLCAKSDYPTVADALGIDQNNLERLVVYYYKDLTTSEILMFTPARDKQLLFPDLVIDNEDELTTITNETIDEVLTPNPSFVSLYDNKYQVSNLEEQIISVDIYNADPIGLNEGIVETAKLPPQNEHVDEDSEYISENSSDVPSSTDTLSFEDGHIEQEQAYDGNPWAEFLSPTDYLQNEDRPINNDEFSWISPVNNENGQQYKPYKPISESEPNLNDHEFNELDLDHDLDHGLDLFEENQPSGDDVNFQNIIPENGAEDQEFDIQNLSLPKLFGKYVTFDKWFDQQMLRINRTDKAPSLSINVKTLKLLVERALYINNMYVTKDGVLIDHKGKVLDVANLKLRPILIGNSVTYDSLLDVTNNKFVLPTNKPYLEAVLVTIVYPPKILDVIPLGKSYVPRASYRKRYNYWPGYSKPTRQLRPKSKNCGSSACNTWDSYLTGKYLSSNYKPHRPKEILSEPIKVNRYSENRNRRERKINRKVKFNEAKKPGTHADILNNVLEVLGRLVNSKEEKKEKHKHHKKIDKFATNILNGNFHGSLHDDDDDDVDDDGFDSDSHKPWFRIIGGNAATSSGTPVSSRGRSGKIFEGSA